MPLLAPGEYRPDVSDYEGKATRNILNVVPRGDGYGPFPAFSAYTSALPSACRGAFYALKSDGTVITFAGTATKLYKLNNTDFTWGDVSKGASTYSALSSTAQWQFAQFGSLVFATQANAPLQVFDLVTTFDAVHDQPRPQALLDGIRRSLRPRGVYLMQDIAGSTHVHENLEHPLGTFLYTISCLHCMTVSLAQGGDGLGAMWGEQAARAMLHNAGFGDVAVRQLDHDPTNTWYVARP